MAPFQEWVEFPFRAHENSWERGSDAGALEMWWRVTERQGTGSPAT